MNSAMNDFFPLISFAGSVIMVGIGYGSILSRLKAVESRCDKQDETLERIARLETKIDIVINRFTFKNNHNVQG